MIRVNQVMMRCRVLLFCATVTRLSGASLGEPLTFTGTCDASAAVSLGGELFAVANDEDNILRFYRLDQAGAPVQTYDLSSALLERRSGPEADIEAAARLGSRCFFITSHGRDAEGKPAPARRRLFALEFTPQDRRVAVQPVGKPCTNLVADMARHPKLAHFGLADASRLAPKTPGSLNIEALTDTPQGALLIGFRSPVPEGRALLVPLLNPNEVLTGRAPEFGDPLRLDLNGLGLRGIGSTGRGYYLLAGPAAGGGKCRLFLWEGGEARPRLVAGVDFSGLNPEAICFHDSAGRSDLVVLSDDGDRAVRGNACKDLPEAQRKFRAYRLTP